MSGPPPQLPPQGWYLDPAGALRWWDGTAWGPVAPPTAQRTEEEAGKALAVISWVGFFVLYGLPAIVIRVVEREGNRFARWHAAEAVNLFLTAALAVVPLWIGTIVSLITSPVESDAPPWPVFAFWGMTVIVGLATLVTIVVGIVRAVQGVWWRCPVALPFLRRHRRERAET